MEMIETDFRGRSDRSYLCLVAIYVIHALLLNVFLQPQLDVRSSVTLSTSYLRSLRQHSSGRNGSYTIIASGEDSVTSIVNNTNNIVRRTFDHDDDDDDRFSGKADPLYQQSKSGGAAIRFLAASKSSEVTRIASNAFDTARQIVRSLSPAALGILSGCLVFLLTFTENDYV